MKRTGAALSFLALATTLSGCGLFNDSFPCDPADRPVMLIEPSKLVSLALTVGERYTVEEAVLSKCHAIPWREVPVREVAWVSETPEVASIGQDTGTITALAPGYASFVATGDFYGYEDVTGYFIAEVTR